jgi:hypothetical protein
LAREPATHVHVPLGFRRERLRASRADAFVQFSSAVSVLFVGTSMRTNRNAVPAASTAP